MQKDNPIRQGGVCDCCGNNTDKALYAFDCAPLAGGAVCEDCKLQAEIDQLKVQLSVAQNNRDNWQRTARDWQETAKTLQAKLDEAGDMLASCRGAVDILRQVAYLDYVGNSPSVEEIDAAISKAREGGK